MMWDDLKKITGARTITVPGGYGEAILLPVAGANSPTPSCWMIGQYKDQTRLATALRQDASLQTFISGQQIRFGLRESDRPPAVGTVRQERYGAPTVGPGANVNFALQRVQPVSVPVRPGVPAPGNRIGDEDGSKLRFWATQTPQSHHVVEFNHLRDMGFSQKIGAGPMDHAQLPCVLLSPEFHQRYFSSILKQTHGWGNNRLRAEIVQTYTSLYVSGGIPFRPLWEVSKIILRAAGLTVP